MGIRITQKSTGLYGDSEDYREEEEEKKKGKSTGGIRITQKSTGIYGDSSDGRTVVPERRTVTPAASGKKEAQLPQLTLPTVETVRREDRSSQKEQIRQDTAQAAASRSESTQRPGKTVSGLLLPTVEPEQNGPYSLTPAIQAEFQRRNSRDTGPSFVAPNAAQSRRIQEANQGKTTEGTGRKRESAADPTTYQQTEEYRIAQREAAERAARLQEYRSLMSRPDFTENSRYRADSGDSFYDMINGDEQAKAEYYNKIQGLYDPGNQSLLVGLWAGTQANQEAKHMSRDQIAIYNYLYRTEGREKAQEYYDFIQPELNAAQRKEEQQRWSQYAEEDPVGTSVFSSLMAPTRALSYIGQTADYLKTGKIDENAAYNRFSNIPADIRGTVSQQIENSGKWGKAGSFVYQTAMSMGDFVSNLAASGGIDWISLGLMGTGAAADTVISSKRRGLSDTDAFILGTIAGAAEIITEKVSLDKLLDATSMGKSTVGYLLQNILAEGSEEVGSDAINLLADILVMGKKSEWKQSIRDIQKENPELSEKQAWTKAFVNQAEQMGLSFLGGALSGAGMAGGGIGVNYALNRGGTVASQWAEAKAMTDAQEMSKGNVAIAARADENASDSLRRYADIFNNRAAEAQALAQGADPSTLSDAAFISEQEAGDYFYLWESQGAQAADAFYEQVVEPDLDRRRMWAAVEYRMRQEQEAAPPQNAATEAAVAAPARVETAPQAEEAQRAAERPTEGGLRIGAAEALTQEAEDGYTEREPQMNLPPMETARTEETNGREQQAEAADGGESFAERAGKAAAGRTGSDRSERATGVGRLLEDYRHYRALRGAEAKGREGSRLQNEAEVRNLRRVSAADYGLKNGSSARTARELTSDLLNREQQRAVADYDRQGVKLRFISGQLETNKLRANGKPVTVRAFVSGDGKTIVVQADHPTLSWKQLLDHEELHRRIKMDKDYRKAVEDALFADKQLAPKLSEIFNRYAEAYDAVGISDEDEVLEEMLADYRAGFDMMDPLGKNAELARTAKRAAKDIRRVERKSNSTKSTAALEKDVEESKPLSVADTAKASMEFDSKYMSAAIRYNDQHNRVPVSLMSDVAKVRETIKSKLEEIKDIARLPEDKVGNTYFKNSSYSGSEENTTVCPRSVSVDALADAVGDALGRPLTIEETVYVAQQAFHFTDIPQCLYCYVAMDRMAKRQLLGEYINKRTLVYADLQNGMSRAEALAAFKERETSGGKQWSGDKQKRFDLWANNYEAGNQAVQLADLSSEAAVERALADNSLRVETEDALRYAQNASWAKKRVAYTAYNNHILKWDQKRINDLNSMFGLRLYSFSDFSPAYILENMQMVTDAAARGLKMLAYTKELDFVRIFAGTGMNINISTFGMDGGDGTVHEDAMQGASWKEAQALRDKYQNVGVTFVATNDNQVNWALGQDWIDVVIPFHMVKTGATVAEILGYKNYTAETSDKKIAGLKARQKEIWPNQHQNDKQKYLDALKKANLAPRFERWLDSPNYMKLVNETRRSAQDTPAVLPKFDQEAVDAAIKSLDDMVKRGGYGVPIGGSLDNLMDIAESMSDDIRRGVAQDLRNREQGQPEGKASTEIDTDYLAAVERGDIKTAQRLVDEAARKAGYTVKGYHGTDANFTQFKVGDIGYHIGTEGQAKARMSATGMRSTQADRNLHVMELYARISNPLRTAFDFGDWHGKNVASMLLETEQFEEGYDDSAEEINTRLAEIAAMPDGTFTDKTLREYLKSLGYDGIEYENQFEDVKGGDYGWDEDYDLSYIAFDSDQLKLADPVTYDDDGNVIPLSERFNQENDDIRYSTEIDDGVALPTPAMAERDVREMENNPDTFIDSTTGERVKYSYDIDAERAFQPLRDEDGNIKYVYKAFYVMKDENGVGRLYPPMVSNVSDEEKKKVKGAVSGTQRNIYTPLGIVLTADVGMLGRYKSDTTDSSGVTHKAGDLIRNTLGRLAVENDKGGGTLAFRPGWHLGEWPDAKQFNKDSKTYGPRSVMPDQLVFARCEIAGAVDYQLDAMRSGVGKKGKYKRAQAGLPRVPVNGYYKYRTNPNPDTAPWYITGQMRVVEILTDEQCREICAEYGVEMSPRESGHDIDLEAYGLKPGPVERETDTDRFLKSEKSKANERELEMALADPDYADAYKPGEIDFSDPEILKEFERNRQDAEYYRQQYQERFGKGSASIEIDPEVAESFSLAAVEARRQERQSRTGGGRRKVSKVRSNTYENSGLFNEVEASMAEADHSKYEYNPISDKESMARALRRLNSDFDGEVRGLAEEGKEWGTEDLDTAMGILHRYRTEGRATGDYRNFWEWSKVIQRKGTKAGQFIHGFAKYTRTGTGRAAKAAADIHRMYELNPAQQKKAKETTKRVKKVLDDEAKGAAEDGLKKAKGQKTDDQKKPERKKKSANQKEIRRRKDAERLVRRIYDIFEQQNQRDRGPRVDTWLDLTGEALAEKIANRFKDGSGRDRRTTMKIVLADLMGFAKEHALPERQRDSGATRTAIDTITDYLNNRDAYGQAWAQAQDILRAQYADDEDKLDALNAFLTATISYDGEGTDRTMLDAILQSADVLGISEKRIKEIASTGATEGTINAIADELVNQVQERMGADWQESYGPTLRDAVRRHITGISLEDDGQLRLRGLETDAARQLDINLQRLLTESRGDKTDAARRVAQYLVTELGIPSGDAALAAQNIVDSFLEELADRADRKLQSMFAERTPQQRTQRDKLLDLIRLGGFTNANVEDGVVDALGLGDLSREEQRRIIADMARFGEIFDSMEEDDLDGLRNLIRQQAAVRRTKLSRMAEKVLAGATDAEYLRDFALAQLDAIAGDYARRSVGARLSTYQTMSHLINARTALRNISSNQVFDLVESAANNLSLVPDMVLGALTGERTVGVNKSWASRMKRQGAIEGAGRNLLEVRLDVSPDERQHSKYGTAGRRTFSLANSGAFGKLLSHLEEVMGYELNTTDEFHKGSVRGETLESLARFVEQGKLTQEQANAFAEEEALYRAFQDDTLAGTMLGELKALLNVLGWGDSAGRTTTRGTKIKDFGLGDFVVKYTQVPGALVHRGIEFSPLGYAKTVYDLAQFAKTRKRGESTTDAQRRLALDIGRATTGTGLIVLFAALAKAGLLRRDEDDKDKNARALHNAQGLSGTQLDLTGLGRWIEGEDPTPQDGDVLADIAFLEPLDSLMTIAALLAKEDEINAATVGVKSLDGVWKAIQNTSAMQTVSNIVSTVQYHDEENDLPLYMQIPIEVASDSVSGFIPAPIRQIAQATDTTYRDQYRSKDVFKQIGAKTANAIPGVRQKLAPKITPLGEDKKYQEPALNAVNALLSPGNISVYQADEVVDELNRVYDATEDAKIWPERNAPYAATLSGEKLTLTPDERTQYQRTRGQQTDTMMAAVMETGWYQKMPAESQAEVLNWIGAFANHIAKSELAEGRDIEYGSETYDKYYASLQAGTAPADVVAERYSKTIGLTEAGFTPEQMDEVQGMKAGDFRDYLRDQDLSDEEKLTALGAVLGTDMQTASGNPSQWANVNTAVNDGNSVDKVLEWVQNDLLDDYMKYRDSDVKKARVSVDVYMTYRADTGKMTADKDSSGKTISGSKKTKVVNYIAGLKDLTSAQKDALYYDAGYAESGLDDTPWHSGGGSSGLNARAATPTLRLPTVEDFDGEPVRGLRLPTA